MEWRETLVEVRRTRNDCVFGLRLSLEPDRADRGISFTESYVYLPMPGDPGREYIYTVFTPYAGLGRLVVFFEERLGQTFAGVPADRLIGCFRALVASGQLGDDLALQENHRRVAAWFEAAGAPAGTETWSWINSE